MAYAQRWSGGFVNGDAARQVDATFLNAVEAALLALFDANPSAVGQVPVWNGTKFAPKLLTNAEIDATAAIAKSKLGALSIADADVAGAAAIAKSKLNLAASLVQPTDFAAGSKITTGTMAAGRPVGPADKDIWIATYIGGVAGVRWMFQYNASNPTSYKWEFVGGPALHLDIADWTMTGAGAWQFTGAVITIPLSGIYDTDCICLGQMPGAGDQYMGLSVNGANPTVQWKSGSSAGAFSAVMHTRWRETLGTSDYLSMAHYSTPVLSAWNRRSIDITPVGLVA